MCAINWTRVNSEIQELMLEIGSSRREIKAQLAAAPDIITRLEILYSFNQPVYKLNRLVWTVVGGYEDAERGIPPPPQLLAIDPHCSIWAAIFLDREIVLLQESEYAYLLPFTLFEDRLELVRGLLRWIDLIYCLLDRGQYEVAFYSYEMLFHRIATARDDQVANDAMEKLSYFASIALDSRPFRTGCRNALIDLAREDSLDAPLQNDRYHNYRHRAWLLGQVWRAARLTHNELQSILAEVQNACAHLDAGRLEVIIEEFAAIAGG